MQARLALSHKVHAPVARDIIGDDPRHDSRLADLRLLRALPAIRQAEHVLDLALHAAPELGPVRVRLADKGARAGEEVEEKVGEDRERRLGGREWGEIRVADGRRAGCAGRGWGWGCVRAWAEVQFEPRGKMYVV